MINPDTKSIIDKILNLLHKSNSILGLENKVYAVVLDNESEEYYGCNFQMNQLNFKFRKSKITPKKVGQFVTLWKRNNENQTAPFHENDNFDYYLIASEQENKLGFFLFTKIVLIEKQILSTDKKEGKRGFRVYPTWTQTDNKQAEKTQSWQQQYFIDFSNDEDHNVKKIIAIVST